MKIKYCILLSFSLYALFAKGIRLADSTHKESIQSTPPPPHK